MTLPPFMKDLGTLQLSASQRDRWKKGNLAEEWALLFPFLFDEDDTRLANSQGIESGTHFIGWLGAIVLYHSTGFHSLLNKYEFKTHPKKREIVKSFLPNCVQAVLDDRKKGAQCPDLLMYAPNLSDWFFCEIKGPGDRLRPNQLRVFERLAIEGGRPVCLLSFKTGRALPGSLGSLE